MSTFYVGLLLAGLYTHAHCQQQDPPRSPKNIWHSRYENIAPANADFAFRLFKVVNSANAQENTFFSPLGISISFAMLSLGAKGNTQSQLLTGLGFNRTDIRKKEIHDGFFFLLLVLNNFKDEIELNIGDALFMDEKQKPLKWFLDDAKYYYKADTSPANFAHPKGAEQQINSYIDKKTHGKFVDVVKNLDPRTVMVLVNYIFMKAYWMNPFDYQITREHDFFVDEHTTVKVPMMRRDGNYNYYYDMDLSCQVVQLLYNSSASAIFVLPDPGKMKQLENALNRKVFFKWLNLLKSRRIDLLLPKLSLSKKYVLKKLMEKLGIVDVFTDNADLSGISGSKNLKVSKAIHDAFLNVHENGTEAATVTVSNIVFLSMPFMLKLDHPFLFFIHATTTNTILFMGKIQNPRKN